LLATTSGCEILHQISHLASLYVATLGGNFIDFGTCVRLQAVPLFGLFAVQGSILATAVDRLVASLFPVL
jgi:hypothetical protein